MVIIDGMRLPPRKILLSIAILIIMIALTVLGYFYKQKLNADKAREMQQRKIQKEQNDRSSYDSTIEEMYNSINVNEAIKLYGLILEDFSRMRVSGWKYQETLCNKNSCNIRFTKMKDRVFKYINIKKGENEYVPIYNQEEMTFEGVKYDVDMLSNQSFRDNMTGVQSCTEFISHTYELNSMITSKNDSKQQLSIQLPNQIFSFSQQYDWATLANIKKGILTYRTLDFYTVNYIKDKYMGQLLVFDQLTINKEDINLMFSYYCF